MRDHRIPLRNLWLGTREPTHTREWLQANPRERNRFLVFRLAYHLGLPNIESAACSDQEGVLFPEGRADALAFAQLAKREIRLDCRVSLTDDKSMWQVRPPADWSIYPGDPIPDFAKPI